MNNIELEVKIKEIIKISNYFDMILAIKDFMPVYKKTDFYKETRQPLADVVKNAKLHYLLQLDGLFKSLQEKISSLKLENLQEVLEQFGDVLDKENEEIKTSFEMFKDIMSN